jgi:hypothetical protein
MAQGARTLAAWQRPASRRNDARMTASAPSGARYGVTSMLDPQYRELAVGVAAGAPQPGLAAGATYAADFGVVH